MVSRESAAAENVTRISAYPWLGGLWPDAQATAEWTRLEPVARPCDGNLRKTPTSSCGSSSVNPRLKQGCGVLGNWE
jgi:hypothetical protein